MCLIVSYVLTKSSDVEEDERPPSLDELLKAELEEIKVSMDAVSSICFVINVSVTNLYAAIFWLKGI